MSLANTDTILSIVDIVLCLVDMALVIALMKQRRPAVKFTSRLRSR